ncbi:MAG TPA: PAS domain S-box protein [Gaiellaceae bacterium]
MSDVGAIVHQTLLGEAWDHAALAVAVFADDGRYLACNEEFCRLTGYRREEIVKMRVGVDLAVDAKKNTKLFREIAAQKRIVGSGGLRRKDGSELDVNFWAVETTTANLPYFVVLYWPASERPKRTHVG